MQQRAELAASDRSKVFWVGVLALFTAGVSAALRAAIATDLKTSYLDPIDLARSATMIGEALGAAFLAFSLMLVVTSTLLDKIGMKRMLLFASVAFVVATALIAGCGAIAQGPAVYYVIFTGMFINGLAWGAVEGTINPMIASLYPDDTTHRMNMLHAWWPAGLIVGGLLGVFGAQAGLDWRMILAVVPIAAVAFGFLTLGRTFPVTTSVALGVDTANQFKEILRRPSFLIWFVLMLFTAASELAPGQWVDVALTNVVGMRGVLLLVYVAGIQFVGRHFAGPLAHRLSAEGLLCGSCVLAAIGLFGLGLANSPVTAIVAATAWGLGVCYLWPTMVATAAERYPRGGALTVGMMGVAGSLSTYFVLPMLGAIYDNAKLQQAGGAEALAALTPEQLQPVLVFAAGQSFKAVSIIPALLVVAFAILWLVGSRQKTKAHGAAGEAPSAL
jgi:MFS family permease